MSLRGASAAGNRRISVWPDDRDGLDLGRIQRQKVAVILQQGQALQRAVQSNRAISHRVGRVSRIELRTVQEAIAQHGAQQPQHLVVDGGFLHRAGLDRGQQNFAAFMKRALGISRSRPLLAAATPS